MRKNRTWAIAALAALLLLMAADSAFASKDTTTDPQPPPQAAASQDQPAPADSSEPPVNITLHLSDAADLSAASQPSVPETVGSAIARAAYKARELALGFLGTPYRWGGTTPAAFDCSGFTRYIYAKLGVRLPRTAREQFKAGAVVKSGQWKPGDLIFFDMMKGYVSHVGMYLGNLCFIHACNPRKGVRIDSLNKTQYKRCYVGARRYEST